MRKIDIEKHVRGESQFIDDIVVPEGTLYAAVFIRDRSWKNYKL